MSRKAYIKNNQVVLIDSSEMFIYETCIFAYYKGYFSLCNKAYFSSLVEIKGVVECFWKTPHIQICSELFAAPEKWLIGNGYVEYIKPEKVKRTKNKLKT